jgi:hypothetical protein
MAACAVLLAAVVAAVQLLRQDSVLQVAEQRLISTKASPPRAPAFSHDGKMMAYVAPDVFRRRWQHAAAHQ